MVGWGGVAYLVHLDCHGAAGGDGALLAHRGGAGVAADVIGGDVGDGVVVQG